MSLGRRWRNLALGRKGIVVIVLPLTALLVSTAAFLFVERRESETQREVVHAVEVREQIRQTTELLLAAETGLRGYLLTLDDAFLTPYETAAEELPERLEGLRSLVSDDPRQVERLEQTARLAGESLELLGGRGAEGPPGRAERDELLATSMALQDRLGTTLGAMREHETRFLQRKTASLDRTRTWTFATIAASVFLGLLGGLVAMFFFTSGVVRRVHRLQANARRVEEREELLPMARGDDELGQLGRQIEVTALLLEDRREELGEAQRFLEQLIERSPVIIFRRRPDDLQTTFVSSNIERLLGYTPREMTEHGDLWIDCIHPDDVGAVFEQTRAGLASDVAQLRRPRFRFRRKDGDWVWLEAVVEIDYVAGEPTELLGYAIDVTVSRRTEQELAEREATLSAILETSPDVIVITDELGRRSYASPSLTDTLGYAPEEALGGGPEAVHPEDRRLAVEQLRNAATGEETARARYRMRHKDGHWVWLDVRAQRLDVNEGVSGSARGRRDIILSAREVTAQVELEAELRRAKEEAESSSRAKSEFLSRMSHELRTPLNAILGFAQILEMEELDERSGEGVDEILKGGRHLLDLINEVLDIARIETGKLGLSLEPVQVAEIVNESVALVRPLAGQRDVAITAPAGIDESWHVMADRQRLKQVLLNLLSNAVKYNRRWGRVELTCEPNDRGLMRFRVADTGPGIPSDRMSLLFSPFERLGAEHTGVEGTGLGLALSKVLVEAMGGAIDVESSPERGSRFSVTLLVVEGPTHLVRLTDAGGETPAGSGVPRTLLYIEDNLSNLRLVEHLLAGRPGLKLHAAMQGRLGLDLIKEHHPDLVLLDLNLPDIPGAEVLATLRDDPTTRAIPVVIISADATSHQIDRLLAAGASAYLTKPLDIQRFLQVLDEFLEQDTAFNGSLLRADDNG